jgi:hypothetical protein
MVLRNGGSLLQPRALQPRPCVVLTLRSRADAALRAEQHCVALRATSVPTSCCLQLEWRAAPGCSGASSSSSSSS